MKIKTANIASIILALFVLMSCANTEPPTTMQGTGQVMEYHANGKLKRTAEYTDGQLVSVVSYFASGTEESNEHFDLGELRDATYYFADGRVRMKIRSR